MRDRITEAIVKDLRKAGFTGDPTDREAVKAFLKRRDHAGWHRAHKLGRACDSFGRLGNGTLLKGGIFAWIVAKLGMRP